MSNTERQTPAELPVAQLGVIGAPDMERSDGRAYWTLESTVDSLPELVQDWRQLQSMSEQAGRRRTVFRARATAQTIRQAREHGLPVEVVIPLQEVDPSTTDSVVILGENVHTSSIPEWESLLRDWQHRDPISTAPAERLTRLPNNFRLEDRPHFADADRLLELWLPFGWTPETIRRYIAGQQQPSPGFWFSALRDSHTGNIVSACMGEGADLAGQYVVEATEYGTLPQFQGQGFSTAAVIGLTAQILRDTYYQSGQMPLLLSEFSLSSRSDMVGRNVGMILPGIMQASALNPTQILSRNVAVLDGLAPNSLDWHSENLSENYRAAFGEPDHYHHWRNFVVGILPLDSVQRWYQPEQLRSILSRIHQKVR